MEYLWFLPFFLGAQKSAAGQTWNFVVVAAGSSSGHMLRLTKHRNCGGIRESAVIAAVLSMANLWCGSAKFAERERVRPVRLQGLPDGAGYVSAPSGETPQTGRYHARSGRPDPRHIRCRGPSSAAYASKTLIVP
jgi:hypothetical protein